MLKLGLLALVIHLLFLYSVFDLYFTSPLVKVEKRFSPSISPPAKRLFLFVCDGLRVDKFYGNQMKNVPFLKGLIGKGAVYGISNTKVPTESRPGHVAMIAGFYEDVAAITKGWKENPVEFDSVFNQSRHTWSWGSPDILPMFERGAVPGRVSVNMYHSSLEDFAKNASILDIWVFDKVTEFFDSADNDLKSKLQEDQLVFFLHLLGTDTIGHADKPHHPKYSENVALVDRGIEQLVDKINIFFNDDRTAFIFSSDHGMRDWGSHGAGHPDETMTPFVGWGAGLSLLKSTISDFSPDIKDIKQFEQADIAPLMSCLIGANFPANSVGKVPTDFLDTDNQYKSDCLLTNARQLAETAIDLHNAYKSGSLLSFSPYPDFDIDLIQKNLEHMQEQSEKGQFRQMEQQANIFIDHMLAASRYYHTYNNTYLGLAVTAGFLFWIAYVLSNVMENSVPKTHTYNLKFNSSPYNAKNLLLSILTFIVSFILLLKKSPISHYAYWLVPLHLSFDVYTNFDKRCGVFIKRQVFSYKIIASIFVIVVALEAVVWSYWHRMALVVAILSVAIFTALFSHKTSFLFPISTCLLAIFPMLPPADSGQQAFELVYVVTAAVIIFSLFSTKMEFFQLHCNEICGKARNSQIFMLTIALLVKIITVYSVQDSHVPIVCHILSWLLLIFVWIPVLYTCPIKSRLFSVFLAIFTIYQLLSVYYESLYLVSLYFVLFVWVNERQKNPESNDFTSMITDSFILVILINVSLLAPANIAVINSFDLVSVYTFLTLFAPFIIMALLIIKVVLPVVCVVLAFVQICHIRNYSIATIIFLVMAFSDFTALHFFFAVRTEGSWLEIGTSLSHYAIQMFKAVALIPFIALARFLLFQQLSFKHIFSHDSRKEV